MLLKLRGSFIAKEVKRLNSINVINMLNDDTKRRLIVRINFLDIS